MSIWPNDVQESVDKLGSNWLKPIDFEEGLTLQIKSVEKIKGRNPKYAAQATDYLVKNEILEVGETFHFVFVTPEGEERQLDSKSTPFFIGMKQAECEPGDWVKITRTGKTDETRYTVEKVEKPEVSQRKSDEVDYPTEEPREMPF